MNNPNPDGKPLIQQFSDAITDLIYNYNDSGLTVGETIGALEMCKLSIFENIDNDEEEEEVN